VENPPALSGGLRQDQLTGKTVSTRRGTASHHCSQRWLGKQRPTAMPTSVPSRQRSSPERLHRNGRAVTTRASLRACPCYIEIEYDISVFMALVGVKVLM